MSQFDNANKPPKTLVSGIKRKAERACDGLRNYEPPTEVRVFKLNEQGNMELIRIEQPTELPITGFNGRNKR